MNSNLTTAQAKIFEQVTKAIIEVKEIPAERVTPDSTFEELGVDSLDAIEILFELEDSLDVDVPDGAARLMRNVRQVVEGLEKLMAGEEIEMPTPESTPAGETQKPDQAEAAQG